MEMKIMTMSKKANEETIEFKLNNKLVATLAIEDSFTNVTDFHFKLTEKEVWFSNPQEMNSLCNMLNLINGQVQLMFRLFHGKNKMRFIELSLDEELHFV